MYEEFLSVLVWGDIEADDDGDLSGPLQEEAGILLRWSPHIPPQDHSEFSQIYVRECLEPAVRRNWEAIPQENQRRYRLGIGKYLKIDFLKALSKRAREEESLDALFADAEKSIGLKNNLPKARSAEDDAILREALRKLPQFLKTLKRAKSLRKYAELAVSRYDISTQEAALILDVKPVTVRQIQCRLREKWKKFNKDEDQEDGATYFAYVERVRAK
jgi:DNA-directed RNA polymerase specialized sigma24 family protein